MTLEYDPKDILRKLHELREKYAGIDINTTFAPTDNKKELHNLWADFWRYCIGVNVIPAHTSKKIPSVQWSEWQVRPIPHELHEEWKSQGFFLSGMALVLGKVWHRKDLENYYLVGGDADNRKAIDELLSMGGQNMSLEDFARKTIVEQHNDSPDKMHFYFYCPKVIVQKSSDVSKVGTNANELPAFEIKSSGKIMFCAPSIHTNGFPYLIKGSFTPAKLSLEGTIELENHFERICKKYGLSYLKNSRENGKALIPIKHLFENEFRIFEGQNRHEALLRAMESLIARNSNILSLHQIKGLCSEWNNEHCSPPLDNKEFEKQWTDALTFVSSRTKKKERNENPVVEETEDSRLTKMKLTKDDLDFVFKTMKKEAENDELALKQIFYGMVSAFTRVPLPHVVNSKDSGAGKSYLLNYAASYFPDKYVITLAGISDKAIFHMDGTMVIEDKTTGEIKPIEPIVDGLRNEIDQLEEDLAKEEQKDPKSRNKGDIQTKKQRIKAIGYEIMTLEQGAEKLIDLSNQIIVALDTPQESLFAVLMSLMSQDTQKDQRYSFVEKSGSGKLREKKNRLRGMPVLFSTQVIDDTGNSRFEEKNRRFINVTPDTSKAKIRAAKRLIGMKSGCTDEEYSELVVSPQDKEKVKEIIKVIIAKLKEHSKYFGPKQTGVKIPFVSTLVDSIPEDRVWEMTVADRAVKYISVITKINMDERPKLVNEKTGAFYPISTFDDLKETLRLMERGAIGVRPYLASWYNEVFLPAFKGLHGKPNEDKSPNGTVILNEKHVGLNIQQLVEKTRELQGLKQSSEEIREKYVYPLTNQGLIDKVKSEINFRQNIYFPVEESPLSSIFGDSGDLKLRIKYYDIYPTKNFIEDKFRTLKKRNADQDTITEEKSSYKIVDVNGEELSVEQLVEKYFSHPEDYFEKDYDQMLDKDGRVVAKAKWPRQTGKVK